MTHIVWTIFLIGRLSVFLLNSGNKLRFYGIDKLCDHSSRIPMLEIRIMVKDNRFRGTV